MAHPPKPQFALTVGIIGHRPNRLPEAARPQVEADIRHVLTLTRQCALAAYERHRHCFSEQSPIVALISALAEGADTIAADAALAAGFLLDAVLPFALAEYAKDFGDAARAKLNNLLSHTRAVLELPGARASEGKSYEAAGLVVLDNADILIAVWDGGISHGRGGTAEMIAEAGRRGIPVVHIDAKGANRPSLKWQGIGSHQGLAVHILDHPSAALDEKLDGVIDALVCSQG